MYHKLHEVPDEVWSRVEKDYIKGVPLAEIEKIYHIKYGVIAQKASKSKWRIHKNNLPKNLPVKTVYKVKSDVLEIAKNSYMKAIDEVTSTLKEKALYRIESILAQSTKLYQDRFDKLISKKSVDQMVIDSEMPGDGYTRLQAEALCTKMDTDIIKCGVALVNVILKSMEMDEVMNPLQLNDVNMSFSDRFSGIFEKVGHSKEDRLSS